MKYFAVIALCILGAMMLDTAAAEDCPTVCPLLYSPVCGQDEQANWRTFSNRCELTTENCDRAGTFQYVRDGEC